MSDLKLYLVGGAVRRHMLGLTPTKDLDFAVEAPSYEAMRDGLLGMGLHVWQERPEFVTLRGKIPTVSLGRLVMLFNLDIHLGATVDADFTLCRAEAQYHDKRHPSTVTPASLGVDLSRRDFSVNAVAIDVHGNWYDPYGGGMDADARVLRCVGDPHTRFEEDPLRMLRAVRFHVTENLNWHYSLWDEMFMDEELARSVSTLPVERVHSELNRALAHNWHNTMFCLLHDAPYLARALSRDFPSLWLKATTEKR